MIIGIDEAGRGPIAGPVVCAAVACRLFQAKALPPNIQIKDSKQLTERQRKSAFFYIIENFPFAVSLVDAATIDKMNILNATYYGMGLALKRFLSKYGQTLQNLMPKIVIDGKETSNARQRIGLENMPCEFIPKADTSVLEVSCASIVAKYIRDSFMRGLNVVFAQYEFHTNKGYATKRHLELLEQHGPCPHHRRSYEPVIQRRLF